MYWQSLWFRAPASGPPVAGFFLPSTFHGLECMVSKRDGLSYFGGTKTARIQKPVSNASANGRGETNGNNIEECPTTGGNGRDKGGPRAGCGAGDAGIRG